MFDTVVIFAAIIGAAAALLANALLSRRSRTLDPSNGGTDEARASADPGGFASAESTAEAETWPNVPADVSIASQAEGDIYEVAAELDGFYGLSAHPKDLLAHPRFSRGVEMLGRTADRDTLLLYAVSGNQPIVCMALETLARLPADPSLSAPLRTQLNEGSHWAHWFGLRALERHADGPVLPLVLAEVDHSWAQSFPARLIGELLQRRIAAGEEFTFGERLRDLPGHQRALVKRIFELMGADPPPQLTAELAGLPDDAASDAPPLGTIGRLWRADVAEPFVIEHASIANRVDELTRHLAGDRPRSVLLVGDEGVGKTSLVHLTARRLMAEGWTVIEASASDILAGQMFIGQLEEQVRNFVSGLSAPRTLWFAPSFHDLLWAGQHRLSPTGALDLVLPAIESGAIRVVGEVPSAGLEMLLRQRPRLRSNALEVLRVPPLSESDTMALAGEWVRRRAGNKAPVADEALLREVQLLARHFLADRALPGSTLQVLAALERLVNEDEARETRAATVADVITVMSRLTGLPASILDERRTLDLGELRARFERNVLGQPEAVNCLVERVAMIKAGVTDPTRPQGVFLFVGPTGTGKTELAKTLAESLFGSAERMIRLDMSELQMPDSLDRLVGGQDEHGISSTALVNAIRKQPFSVVLLDEFEKAHPHIWDLFLQVFDDGRLTDRRGNVADFRHAIVIMTSNLGAAIGTGASVGFSAEGARFGAVNVERAVRETFRPEFLNRIDRVVVFHPLGRSVMRDLLRKELNDVLHRRGLRNRTWAVEFDESALDFLLTAGFTAELGARPLKRAVERYLLAPLATTIVNRQVPEGDQFLFVRSDGRSLQVEFVDPDALDVAEPELPGLDDDGEVPSVRSIVLSATGSGRELDALSDCYDELMDRVESEEWQEKKRQAMSSMTAPGFWERPDRFVTLGLAEYMDRIETGVETAGSLLHRLQGAGSRRSHLPVDLVGRLAQQVFLIDAAIDGMDRGLPRDAFILVEARVGPGTSTEAGDAFAERLIEMYHAWAQRRRMHIAVLRSGISTGGGQHALMSITGFAAFPLLLPEDGLHVLETPQGDRSFDRARALVRVVPQPDLPAVDAAALLRQALEALEGQGQSSSPAIVRRYREEPSPLVRDTVRQWRTGRLDRVLDGEFDVMG